MPASGEVSVHLSVESNGLLFLTSLVDLFSCQLSVVISTFDFDFFISFFFDFVIN